MFAFEVQDMSCGHCVATITKALKALDSSAEVAIDLATHRVQVQTSQADASQVAEAIREAGYTPAAQPAG